MTRPAEVFGVLIALTQARGKSPEEAREIAIDACGYDPGEVDELLADHWDYDTRDAVTHRKFVCEECETVVWLPVGTIDPSDHAKRAFCGCDDQGIRMDPVNGPDGEVRL